MNDNGGKGSSIIAVIVALVILFSIFWIVDELSGANDRKKAADESAAFSQWIADGKWAN